MHATDLERMIAVADEFFEAKNDPDQILVNEGILEGLKRIHPVTLSEETDDDGLIAWMLVIPTTHTVMEQVIRKETSERGILELTLPRTCCDALCLCSAIVLLEHGGEGLAKRLVPTRSVPSRMITPSRCSSTGHSVRRGRDLSSLLLASSSCLSTDVRTDRDLPHN